jgi:hypothetical protein
MEFNKTPINQYKPVTLSVQDGKIVGYSQEKKPVTNRQAIENAQLKYNTEALSGTQPAFGVSPKPVVPPKPVSVSKKENSYSINGKDYTESQLLKMGYTKEQIAPYIKK